jgi:two-component system response regulator RegA
MQSQFKLRVLVVEDDPLLAETLTEQLTDWGFSVQHSETVSDALIKLEETWTLMLLDLALPDRSGLSLAQEIATRASRPLTIAVTGTATVEEAFALAQAGVRAYLPKPLNLADLRQTISTVLEQATQDQAALEEVARAEVGSSSYQEVTARVRRAMVDQALLLSHGSKTGAARLLQVSRQAVQQLIRSLELPDT